MKYITLSFVLAFIATLACQGQGKYQISGKIAGVSNGSLMLVRNDGPKADTLAITMLKNGVFVFAGELDAPSGGYVTTADGSLVIPLIIEPTNIMVNVTASSMMIQGGEQQTLFARYNQIAQAFAAEQARVQAEAQQPGADMDALQARIDQAYQNSLAQTNELIKANPDAYATAYVISLGARNETEASLQAKYDLLGETAKASVPGQQILAALDQFAALEVGREAPNFTTSDIAGNSITFHAVTAKIKLLVFWASWDAASRQLNPELIQLYRQFRPRGLEIVSISLDDNFMDWAQATRADGIIWPNGSDLQGMMSPVAKAYMVGSALPYTVLVDAENRILAKGLLGDDLRKQIFELTKKKK